MISVDDALEALDQVYAAAEGMRPWEGALETLADLLGYQQGNIEFHDLARGGLRHMETARIDPDDIAIYARDFARDNPRVNHLRAHQTPLAFDHMFISEEEMDHDPFYAEFLTPRRLRYFMSSNSDMIGDNMQAILALQRDTRRRETDDDGIRIMGHLRPHLNRALRMTWTRLNATTGPERLERDLRNLGLTEAETRLAQALTYGDTLQSYAARREISMNTVYTHYARIKSKLDCRGQPDLVRRLELLKRGALD